MNSSKNRYFIITIDTEGDNLWAVSDIKNKINTENAAFLFRFQELCERYRFVPTYLTNYEMANDRRMIELGHEGLKNKTLEIGSHVHAWNQPPYYPLVKRVGKRGKPFLGEYPKHIIRSKLEYLTKTLEDVFQCPVVSHRGGRWYADRRVFYELDRLGYIVDCSATPFVNWNRTRGWTPGSHGTDWSFIANKPSIVSCSIRKGSMSGILEIPMTIDKIRIEGRECWLRPDGKNLKQMKMLVDKAIRDDRGYIEFMLHSSELMPGGSPVFRNKGMIEHLYRDLEELFTFIVKNGFKGISISNYANIVKRDLEEGYVIEYSNINK